MREVVILYRCMSLDEIDRLIVIFPLVIPWECSASEEDQKVYC